MQQRGQEDRDMIFFESLWHWWVSHGYTKEPFQSQEVCQQCIDVLVYSAPQLQECLINLLTYLLTYLHSVRTYIAVWHLRYTATRPVLISALTELNQTLPHVGKLDSFANAHPKFAYLPKQSRDQRLPIFECFSQPCDLIANVFWMKHDTDSQKTTL